MRAIVYTAAGGPDVIAIRDVPLRQPGRASSPCGEAAGLNRADIYQRRGGYAAPPGGLPTSRDWSTPAGGDRCPV